MQLPPYASAMPCPVLKVSGTDIRNTTPRNGTECSTVLACLSAWYAMSGTDLGVALPASLGFGGMTDTGSFLPDGSRYISLRVARY
eukprot:3605257-Rhodomonas_salina.2